jgi:adenine-specific DNA-methyltransferase
LIDNIDFKKFPTTRYQGSKRKIIPWLYEIFRELKFNTVLDGCGGSGSVSYLLKKMGKTVTYNDKLYFNYLIGVALIENNTCTLTNNDIKNLLGRNPSLIYKTFIKSNFRGIYYLDKENEWLDIAANNIINMNHYRENILQYNRALAYYALFQSSLIKRPFNLFHRKNLDIRMNDVIRNFGNKTTWDRPFEDYFVKFATEVNDLIFYSPKKCIAKNESILKIEQNGYDLVYIDPPYIHKDKSNESSKYFDSYHFLEGLARYEDWGEMIDYETKHRRLKNDSNNDEFTKQNCRETIERILVKFRKSKIVFSYKSGGVPPIDFIVKLMKKIKKSVYTRSKHYGYALNHQNGDASKNREVLIIGI